MWAGRIALSPVQGSSIADAEPHGGVKSHRSSLHAFTHAVADDASVGTSLADAINARTVRLRVVPPKTEAVEAPSKSKPRPSIAWNPETERIYHVHAAILRAYSPILAARLDVAADNGPPPEEAALSEALSAIENRLFAKDVHASGADWSMGRGTAAVIQSAVVVPIAAGSGAVAVSMKKKMEPEIIIEGSPSIFKIAIDWMYGRDLNIRYADMMKWVDTGCELLTVAQNLGIDSLVYALRRTISEACTRGGSQLAWAMLQVCYRHDLQLELQHACRTIARTSAYEARKHLGNLSADLFSLLLSSTAWIVDSDDELLDLVDAWVKENTLESQIIDTDNENQAIPATSLLKQMSGKWDVRWGSLQKGRLEACVKADIVPYSLVVDCKKWSDIGSGGDDSAGVVLRAQKEQLAAIKNKKEKATTLAHCKEALERCTAQHERLETRVAGGADPSKDGLGEALAAVKRKVQSLRMQAAVASDMLKKADGEVLRAKESLEQSSSYKPKIKVSEQTMMWRFPRVGEPKLDDRAVQSLLGGVMKRATRKFHVDDKENEQVDNCFVTAFCPWLRRRRCHHVTFVKPPEWQKYFDIISTERDCTLIRSIEGRALKGLTRVRFVGDRLFKRGRHEFLIRIVRRIETDSEAVFARTLKGLRFGIATFDMKRRQLEEKTIHSNWNPSEGSNRLNAEAHDFFASETKHTGPVFPSPRSIGDRGDHCRVRESARKVFSSKTPAKEYLYADMDLFAQILERQTVLDVVAGSVADLVLLVVVENNKLRWAVEQVICNSSESADFLLKHKFLHRWSDESKLEEDLKMGFSYTCDGEDTMLAMALEIDPQELGNTGSVDIEVLPQEALYHSWWVDTMNRSVDGQPHYGGTFNDWGPTSDWAQL